jgi:hypothetical protein
LLRRRSENIVQLMSVYKNCLVFCTAVIAVYGQLLKMYF